jgi:hypothetical protein
MTLPLLTRITHKTVFITRLNRKSMPMKNMLADGTRILLKAWVMWGAPMGYNPP